MIRDDLSGQSTSAGSDEQRSHGAETLVMTPRKPDRSAKLMACS